MSNITFVHTIGDTDPLLVRLTRDGVPAPYLDTAESILITMWTIHDKSQIVIEDGVCQEVTAQFGAGAIKYEWGGVNWTDFPAGLTHAKIVVQLPAEQKTYPTTSGKNKMIVDFITGAP